jgi:hypothetical protein
VITGSKLRSYANKLGKHSARSDVFCMCYKHLHLTFQHVLYMKLLYDVVTRIHFVFDIHMVCIE